MPRPSPLTATTSGLANSARASTRPMNPCAALSSPPEAVSFISTRSVPAEKARPVPVSSTTATSGSSSASRSASARAT